MKPYREDPADTLEARCARAVDVIANSGLPIEIEGKMAADWREAQARRDEERVSRLRTVFRAFQAWLTRRRMLRALRQMAKGIRRLATAAERTGAQLRELTTTLEEAFALERAVRATLERVAAIMVDHPCPLCGFWYKHGGACPVPALRAALPEEETP